MYRCLLNTVHGSFFAVEIIALQLQKSHVKYLLYHDKDLALTLNDITEISMNRFVLLTQLGFIFYYYPSFLGVIFFFFYSFSRFRKRYRQMSLERKRKIYLLSRPMFFFLFSHCLYCYLVTSDEKKKHQKRCERHPLDF